MISRLQWGVGSFNITFSFQIRNWSRKGTFDGLVSQQQYYIVSYSNIVDINFIAFKSLAPHQSLQMNTRVYLYFILLNLSPYSTCLAQGDRVCLWMRTITILIYCPSLVHSPWKLFSAFWSKLMVIPLFGIFGWIKVEANFLYFLTREHGGQGIFCSFNSFFCMNGMFYYFFHFTYL